jgi:hypothetical protein
LQVLLVAGLIRVENEKGKAIDPKELERKAIGKEMFKVESTTITTAQRLQVRKLLQKVGLMAKDGEELAYVPQFLQKMFDLADRAGNDAPQPARPDTTSLDEIRLTTGNEQLLLMYNRRDELIQNLNAWTDLADQIGKRWPSWLVLKRLLAHAAGLPDVEVINAQVKTIEHNRQLLENPDLVSPLVAGLTQMLREQLNQLKAKYESCHQQGMEKLNADINWTRLEPEQKNDLLAQQYLTSAHAPEIKVADTQEILATLEIITLSALADRVAAMPSRFNEVLVAAAEMMEPEARFISLSSLPSRTLKTSGDIDQWVSDARKTIEAALKDGPVILH